MCHQVNVQEKKKSLLTRALRSQQPKFLCACDFFSWGSSTLAMVNLHDRQIRCANLQKKTKFTNHGAVNSQSCQPWSQKKKKTRVKAIRTCAASSAFALSPLVIGTEFCVDRDLVLGAGCGGTCACCSFLMKLSLLVALFGGDAGWCCCCDDEVFCVIMVAVDFNVWLSTSTSLLCGSFELLLFGAPPLPASRTPSIDLR